MKIKKVLALLLAMVMTMALVACGGNQNPPADKTPDPAPSTTPEDNKTPDPEPAPAEPAGATEISLWTYPIGKWGDEATVKTLTDAFTAKTGIAVKVEYLAYADGDDKVNTAITANAAPDLVMEGPERLVANWGANGKMVDLSDLIDDTDRSELNAAALAACTHTTGAIYEYPVVMTAHCMAINRNAFEEAGALQYINEDTHTWTTQQFIDAVAALYAHYGQTVGAVFCAGQGGDQGTRALINNMYGGTFTNAEHTRYTWDDPLNIKALEQLKSMDGIEFDASLAGGDEIAKFYQGALKMAFCWNIAQQVNPNSANTGAEKTVTGDDIVFMSFPSEDGNASLQGGIWGFGIFDNGDQARIDAAKEFIRFFCDSENTVDAVKAANYFATRSSAADGSVDLSGVWADDAIMNEYTKLMPFLGDYYQITTGWAGARTAWWNMLQAVGTGDDVAAAVAAGVAEANAAAAG